MRLLLLSILLLVSFSIEGSELDSLKQVYSTLQTDLERCNLALEIGIRHYQQRDFDDATEYIQQSISFGHKIDNDAALLKAYNNLGNIYADIGDNTSALKNYQTALAFADRLNDIQYQAHINKNIGALFLSLKRFDESLSYYYKAEKNAIEFKDTLLIADCSNNIGTVFEQQNNYTEAIQRYEKSLELYEIIGSEQGIAIAYSNLAIVYKLNKNYKKAIEFNEKSLSLSIANKDKWSEAATLNNLGNLFGEIKKYEQAIDYLKRSLKIATEINAPEIQIAVYESMADAAFANNRPSEAFNYLKQFIKAKEDFNNRENNRVLSEMTVKYESQKKEIENQQLKFDNEIKTSQAAEAKVQLIWGIAFSLLIILLILLGFYLIQRYRKYQQEIKEKQLISLAVFETEQFERKRIAGDLHDGLGQKLAVVKMQLSMLDLPDSNSWTKLLDDAIVDLRAVSHNLMPSELNKGLSFALKELCSSVSRSNTKVKVLFTEQCDNAVVTSTIGITEVYLYRICQELIQNSIKHANANIIQVDLTIQSHSILLCVSDDGNGFNTGDIANKHGIGLKNMENRVAQLNGTVKVISELNKGTNTRIELTIRE
jgi:two-component system, NarL family, sensor kinase